MTPASKKTIMSRSIMSRSPASARVPPPPPESIGVAVEDHDISIFTMEIHHVSWVNHLYLTI